MKKIQVLLLLLLAIGSSGVAQSVSKSVIAADGGETTVNNITYTYTIGETVIANTTASSYIISQGFHPNSDGVSAIENVKSDATLSVYPNPIGDILNVDITQGNPAQLVLQVYDATGKSCLMPQSVSAMATQQTQVDFSSLPSGNYILSIQQGNRTQSSVRIVKQ